MRFAPTDEQEQLREVARAFLAADPEPAWERIVDEQGWQAIAIPEAYGGFGAGFVELALVAEEIGRALAPVPLLANTLAVAAISTGSAAQRQHWLPQIAAGTRAVLACHAHVRAVRTDDGWRLTGQATRVIGGANAEIAVLPTDQGLFVCPADSFTAAPQPALDPTRQLAALQIDAELPHSALLPHDPLAEVLAPGWVLLAAEAVGAAERCLDETVAYAKVRTQFGKPIGSFQAIQHTAADMLLRVESARSAAWYAAWALDTQSPDHLVAARTARAYAGDALFRCAADTIQCHGGIGFTWEHMAHRYFKRARCDRQLLGDPASHREALAAQLLGEL